MKITTLQSITTLKRRTTRRRTWLLTGFALVAQLACAPQAAAPNHADEAIPTKKEKAPMILIAVTSHDQKGDTGQKTGAYLAEVAHPYAAFRAAGFEVEFVSPKGGQVPLDGVDRKDPVNAAFLDDALAMGKLHSSQRPDAVKPERYAAIFYAGGHGTMWDFPDDAGLAKHGAAIYERGGVVAAVCHGPAALVNIKLSNGEYLVKGKDVAAFTNEEERAAGLDKVVPFMLADKLVERGARHKPAANWQAQVVVSERLVTGQNPASATGVAEAVVKLLR